MTLLYPRPNEVLEKTKMILAVLDVSLNNGPVITVIKLLKLLVLDVSLNNGPVITVITVITVTKLLRFFVLNYVYSDVKPTYPGWPQNTTVSLTFIIT